MSQKLYETNSVIDIMKVELTEMEPKLAAKSAAVAELLKNLTKEQAQADKVRSIVKADEEIAKVSVLNQLCYQFMLVITTGYDFSVFLMVQL